ncbi:EutN/CcmL family microcompartment protein [Vagococcus carniphilus]|uniref:EutN/CcmL family microcompartment protein n=1 Tax=Vagococcus carniphilus TaxID=218144 RepID=A0AAW8U6F6_9ENTE|nr:EutN/CcmL family microcompartment protein [Vagococcus carniphilus]MDT2814487.1 EutN/CcmL family microcompartment protein [Vagococcus carniphilus]MDT2830554.1 EutN/CcmL family microcompartment protein [Vagococcus carniphilus]MDT2832600.1 EutN/CcmL family microcompartment protein [Vagococcus carniphilus]MDT2839852.1 EutN/CcmL family microcompartment protein [Vagococcus carniphilus]MDT2849759.1 EutN/CcmL family microcompartment protein [Vagococcus carniphilus]
MLIGKVSGSLWATRKNEHLNGLKFLLVDIEDETNEETVKTIVAADTEGAGFGDLVLVTTGGSARIALESPGTPVDAAIVGIIDSVERNNQ